MALHLIDGGCQEIKKFLAMMKSAHEKNSNPPKFHGPQHLIGACDPDNSAIKGIPAHLTPSTAAMQIFIQVELVLRPPNDEAAELALTSWQYSTGTSLCVCLFTYILSFVAFALPLGCALK
jgi:hypothetical protein